jgi:hypothetical protein
MPDQFGAQLGQFSQLNAPVETLTPFGKLGLTSGLTQFVDPTQLQTNPSLIGSLQIDPGLLGRLRLPPTPAPPAAPPPTGAVQAALDVIPVARDGDIIQPEYHNALRSALVTLAAATTGATTSATPTLDIQPEFHPLAQHTDWVMDTPPVATAAAVAKTTFGGWTYLNGLDGARMLAIAVLGTATDLSDSNALTVTLKRHAFAADSPDQSLATVKVVGPNGPFTGVAVVNVAGVSQATVNEFATIDNTQFLYYLTAEAELTKATATISAIRVSYRM